MGTGIIIYKATIFLNVGFRLKAIFWKQKSFISN